VMPRAIQTLVLLAALCAIAWIDPYRDAVREGNERFNQKNYNEAEAKYNAASPYAPRESERRKLGFNRGDARYMRGDYDAAIGQFRESLESNDRDVQKKAFFNMGNAHLKKGDIDAAIDSYINALKIDPNYLPAQKNIENLLKKKDDQKDKGGDRSKQDRDRKNGGQGKNGDDKKSGADKDKKEDQSDSGRRGRQGSISREQLRNILESMKNRPVRRQKGGSNGRRMLEKPW